MNREAAAVFLNLIGQGIRMTPIFICLRPKHGQYENIAAFSVYIWVIMVAVQSLFKIPDASFFLFRFPNLCLNFFLHRFLNLFLYRFLAGS